MKVKKHVLGVSVALSLVATAQAATYEVVEIDTQDIALNALATAIGEDGQVSVLTTGVLNNLSANFSPANPIIDISLLNFSDTLIALLEDPDAVMQGNISPADYLTILNNFILLGQANLQTQRIGRYETFVGDENGIVRVPAFDQFDQDIGDITRSTSTEINKMLNTDVFVGEGSAPYTKEAFVNVDNEDELFVVREFAERGFVSFDGEIVALPSTAEEAGGWSQALDVNEQLTVVGNIASSALDGFVTDVEECQTSIEDSDIPVNACITGLLDVLAGSNLGVFSNVIDDNEDGQAILFGGDETQEFNIRGAVWQLSESGQVESLTTLGTLRDPTEDETFIAFSRASAINEQGIVVGSSLDQQGDLDVFRPFAVVFDESGTPSHITDNSNSELIASFANDINDNNIVIGTEIRVVDNVITSVFFVHNLNSGETQNPQLFFERADSNVRDINNEGLVVGDTQIEFATNRVRRRAAFLYDLNEDTVFNINDLDSCESPYNIVNADGINEAGEIAATGLIERQARDPLTLELEVDDAGDPVMEEVLVALKLIPIPGGEIEDCTGIDNGQGTTTENLERQGASLSYLLLLLGAGIIARVRLRK